MKESPNFDLHELLESLVNLPSPYTQITLLQLTPELLQFKVQKPFRSKHKKYKIMCTPDQVMKQARVLANGMLKFAICKMVYKQNYEQIVKSQDKKRKHQLLALFGFISFYEILIEQPVHDHCNLFSQITENFKVSKITFMCPVDLTIVAKFISWLHERLVSMHIILSMEISEVIQNQLIHFAQSWINSLSLNPKHISSLKELTFGYPFNPPRAISNFIGRKQQISLFFKERQILTVRQLQQQGRFFILTQHYSLTFLKTLLHILFKDQKGVNLQLPSCDNSKLIDVAQYVASSFRRGFRINIGYQFQLSYNRMILNTINMNESQVLSLMKIGSKSGIYEIVMYSELKYFQDALAVFLKKPFIKFNYFMPLEQLTSEVKILIKKIEAQCTITRANAYSFAGILKHHAKLGYVVVNSVFCALAQYSD